MTYVSDEIRLIRLVQLLVIANIVPSSLILLTLKIEVIYSFEVPVNTTATWCHILEDGILLITGVYMVRTSAGVTR
jgi:hypothetical protein